MKAQIEYDKKTVWVNDETGCCIGRFQDGSVDVHASGAEQMNGGEHCLDCAIHLPFHEAWERFKVSMLDHHGVTIPDTAKPTIGMFNKPIEPIG